MADLEFSFELPCIDILWACKMVRLAEAIELGLDVVKGLSAMLVRAPLSSPVIRSLAYSRDKPVVLNPWVKPLSVGVVADMRL